MVLSGTNIIMFKKSKGLMQDAWAFVKWMTEPQNTARWSVETNYLPVRRSALELPVMTEKFKKYPGLKQAYLQLEWAYPEPRETAWLKGRAVLEEEGLQPALEGMTTASQCLHDAAQKINKQIGNSTEH